MRTLQPTPLTPSGVTPMEVVEINRRPGTGGHVQAVNAHAPAVALDVTLKAARGVLLKGRGLNVELSLDAHVTGDTTSPQLTGAAHVVRGDYDFAGEALSVRHQWPGHPGLQRREHPPRPCRRRATTRR